ncbi:MAG: PAC2 family protein [Nitrososphaera sp.]|uniref:PAC2 family protein n=1 Tax=Nitrososphaera sp. TaxID=1971748 RepID=UPI003D6DED65
MIGLKVHAGVEFSGRPRMVAALPDMGNVAGIGLAYLAKKLDAKIFAELYSYWPPFVSYKDGIVDYRQASYRFYAVEASNLLIFSGDFNPADPRRLYEVCYEALDMAGRMGVQALYSIGAALRQATGDKVYAAANSHAMAAQLTKAGAEMLQGEGQISGFNGLVMGLAKERNLDAACLLGEIDNPNIIQPRAAQSILQVLLKVLEIPVFDMAQLDDEERRKKFMEQQVGYLEKSMEKGGPPGIA